MQELIKKLENKGFNTSNKSVWKYPIDLNAILKDNNFDINKVLQNAYKIISETIKKISKIESEETKESFIIWQERAKYIIKDKKLKYEKLVDVIIFTVILDTEKIISIIEKPFLIDFIDNEFKNSELKKYLLKLNSEGGTFSILSGALPIYWYNKNMLLKIEGELSLNVIRTLSEVFNKNPFLIYRGFKNKYEKLLKKIEELSHEVELSKIINSTIYNKEITMEEELKEREDLFFQFIREDYYEGVGALLDTGININCQDEDGMTGLMVTYSNSLYYISYNIMMRLLERKTDNNIQNRDGNTALMILSNSSYPDAEIEFYINLNLNINFYDAEIEFYNNSNNKTNCNLQNNQGDTALMIALRKNYFRTAYTLIESGKTNVNIVNNIGETALSIVSNFGYYYFGGGSEIIQEDNEDESSKWYKVVFKIIEEMMKEEISPIILEKYFEIFFMYFVIKNDLDNLNKFLEKKKPIILLKKALMNTQNIETIKIILSEDINIITKHELAQRVEYKAFKKGNNKLVNELKELYDDINLIF